MVLLDSNSSLKVKSGSRVIADKKVWNSDFRKYMYISSVEINLKISLKTCLSVIVLCPILSCEDSLALSTLIWWISAHYKYSVLLLLLLLFLLCWNDGIFGNPWSIWDKYPLWYRPRSVSKISLHLKTPQNYLLFHRAA